MLRAWLALALLVCVAACLDTDDDRDDAVVLAGDDARANIRASFGLPDEPYSICEHLPETGPCALLCDRDALVDQYVPAGSCAVFSCELGDGQTINFHACDPGD